MLTTWELRWFCKGTIPTEVENWFNADSLGKPLGAAQSREDVYLYTPECDYLNIKLRQGSLEVKWRKAELGSLYFGDSWEGKVEKWLKWICQDSEQQSIMPTDIVAKRPWVTVKKKRVQRVYKSIAFELTQLNIKNDYWWSIALEMSEENTHQIDNFKNIVSELSKTYRGQKLLADNSYAYPSWLTVVISSTK